MMTKKNAAMLVAMIGTLIAVAGLVADSMLSGKWYEPMAAGFAGAGIVELCAGVIIYMVLA
jgi:hypothetical protein